QDRGDSRSIRKARDRRAFEHARKSLGSGAEDRVRTRSLLPRKEIKLSTALRHSMRWPVVRRGKPLQAWACCPAQEQWERFVKRGSDNDKITNSRSNYCSARDAGF